ncbi:hypothetical protein [Streptomyces sp. bgisy022]|uniref:hypothetical protein n=1 Tax=Streptomyces sp. bgisy022 TaxID=3413769 RepID=UPI003D739515
MTAGVDTPDRRGRTGLDRTGRDLTRNPRVKVRDVRLLSSHWYVERGLGEEGEDIEILELPFRRALEMIRTGQINDAKTIMLLQWAALDGPFAR